MVVFDRGTHRVGDFVMVKVTESSSATLDVYKRQVLTGEGSSANGGRSRYAGIA